MMETEELPDDGANATGVGRPANPFLMDVVFDCLSWINVSSGLVMCSRRKQSALL
jgi:hypothetical protein